MGTRWPTDWRELVGLLTGNLLAYGPPGTCWPTHGNLLAYSQELVGLLTGTCWPTDPLELVGLLTGTWWPGCRRWSRFRGCRMCCGSYRRRRSQAARASVGCRNTAPPSASETPRPPSRSDVPSLPPLPPQPGGSIIIVSNQNLVPRNKQEKNKKIIKKTVI